jgi:hypothetical protein
MNKKISFFCLFFAVVNIAYSQSDFYKAVYNGDIEYIKRYYIDSDYPNEHYDFSNSDLRILRNTIYAMHGYIFKSKDLQEHFQKFAWYKGTKKNVDNELSENEKRIIRIIVATEKANPSAPKDIVGRWYAPTPPGSSQDVLVFWEFDFYEDGRLDDNDSWSLEGTTFCIQLWGTTEEITNFRVNFVEYHGELYKVCTFTKETIYNGEWYGINKRPHASFWGMKEYE